MFRGLTVIFLAGFVLLAVTGCKEKVFSLNQRLEVDKREYKPKDRNSFAVIDEPPMVVRSSRPIYRPPVRASFQIKHMAVLGDSIAKGTFANSQQGKEIEPSLVEKLHSSYRAQGLSMALNESLCDEPTLRKLWEAYKTTGFSHDARSSAFLELNLGSCTFSVNQDPPTIVSPTLDLTAFMHTSHPAALTQLLNDDLVARLRTSYYNLPQGFNLLAEPNYSDLQVTKEEWLKIGSYAAPSAPVVPGFALSLLPIRYNPFATFTWPVLQASQSLSVTDLAVNSLLNDVEYSAFVGSRPYAIAQRLRERFAELKVTDLSVPGSFMAELIDPPGQDFNPSEASYQVRKLGEQYAAGSPKADLILVEFGGNDLMDATEKWHIEEEDVSGGLIYSYRRNLKKLVEMQGDHQTRIVVTGLPDVYSIYEAVVSNLQLNGTIVPIETMERFWPNSKMYYDANKNRLAPYDQESYRMDIKCQDVYQVYQFAGVVRNPRKFITFDQINNRLAEVVREADTLSTNVSVEFVPGALDARNGGTKVDTSLLALDCYHPGRTGHEAIGNNLWQHLNIQ